MFDNDRGELSLDEKKQVLMYLRLCEDQLEMRKLGWITASTHHTWVTGIRNQMKQWPFARIIREVREADGDQLTYLKELCNSSGSYDPLPDGRRLVARLFRGV